jgi:hypothetical protein
VPVLILYPSRSSVNALSEVISEEFPATVGLMSMKQDYFGRKYQISHTLPKKRKICQVSRLQRTG